MADMRFGLIKEDIRQLAFRIADFSGRPHLFVMEWQEEHMHG
jgi:hypothetical protein